MTAILGPRDPGPEHCWDIGWEGHHRRQAALGLSISPAERLRWLEETMVELRRLVGLARWPRRGGPPPG
jgi:hypothetical protein